MDFYSYGPYKADAMRELAERDGIDLAESYAYSDSATDIPMLECVGHPVAVNPDRELAKRARAEGWEVRTFARPVRLCDRVPRPPAKATAAVGGGAAIVTAGVVVWWWLRRDLVRRRAPSSPRTLRDRLGRGAGAASSWLRSLSPNREGRRRATGR